MTSDVNRMLILVITGSVRPGNYTTKASALVIDELRKDPMVRAELVDPRRLIYRCRGRALRLKPPGTCSRR